MVASSSFWDFLVTESSIDKFVRCDGRIPSNLKVKARSSHDIDTE
jgi:hypothetical protein